MSQRIGYARVSTIEQNLDLQKDALKKDNCDRIFEDKVSGVKSERHGLNAAFDFLRPGDVLVVWKLDRLGRSQDDLVQKIKQLAERGIQFKSLTERIDTTTPEGKLTFHIFCALAEFGRDLIRERTLAGLAAARNRGKIGGRKKALDDKKLAMARTMHNDKNVNIDDICKALKVSRPTLYRYLRLGGRERHA